MARGNGASAGTKGRRLGTVDRPPERPGGEVRGLPPVGLSLAVLAAVAIGAGTLFGVFLARHQPKPGWLAFLAGAVALYLLPRRLPGLRERTALRRSRREARRLVKAVRKAATKQREWTGEDGKKKIDEACETVERAVRGNDLAALEVAAKKLDAMADQYLSRKSAAREYAEQIGGAVLLALVLRAFFYEAYQIPSASMVPTLLVGDHLFVNKFVYGFTIPFTTRKLWARLPKRGDIVVFNDPRDPSADAIIKRVIGLPGDKVIVRDRKVTLCPGGASCQPLWTRPLGEARLNGDGDSMADTEGGEACVKAKDPRYRIQFCTFSQFEERIGRHDHRAQAMEVPPQEGPDGEWVVQPGHVFMMGDNRDNSEDSRFGRSEGGFGQVPIDYLKGRADIIWLSLGGPHGLRFSRLFKLLP